MEADFELEPEFLAGLAADSLKAREQMAGDTRQRRFLRARLASDAACYALMAAGVIDFPELERRMFEQESELRQRFWGEVWKKPTLATYSWSVRQARIRVEAHRAVAADPGRPEHLRAFHGRLADHWEAEIMAHAREDRKTVWLLDWFRPPPDTPF
ncbi:hypothetical protein [Methylobacterium fujisawaense]|uniref:hypothetical protein n=2 Tax=Bacteria TaxID=2 RepID=UPI0036F941D4